MALSRLSGGSVADLEAMAKDRSIAVLVAVTLGALAIGVGAGMLALAGHPEAVAGIAVLFLPLVAWRRPQLAVMFAVGVATLIEQFPLGFSDSTTDRIPLFRTLKSVGVASLQVTPLELALMIVFVVWFARAAIERDVRLPRSGLSIAMLVLAGIIALYEVYGIARGGNFQASVWELRGWFYLFAIYFMAARFLQSRPQVGALLWILVIGIGIKGLQGSIRYLFFVRGQFPQPNSILEHPEAFSFALFAVIVGAAWLLGLPARVRAVTTALLPLVLLADLANNRRAAWIVAGAGLAILLVMTWLQLPQRRRLIAGMGAALAVSLAVYLPLEWHGTGVLAQPARAIASAFSPSARDESSDFYRLEENYNLETLIKASPVVGAGFGHAIDQAIPLWDATGVDPLINYIPHNQVLYLWVRLGTPGFIVFWWMIGMAYVAAARLGRSAVDRRDLLVAILASSAVTGYLIEAWLDQGFVSPRVTIIVGALLGCVHVLNRLRSQPGAKEKA